MKRIAIVLLCLTCLIALADRRGQIMSQRPTSAATTSDITSNMLVWLDAASIVATNTAVSSTWTFINKGWSNQVTSGSTSNFSWQVALSPGDPVYNTTVQNNLPGVHLGFQSGMNGGLLLNSGGFTLFLVSKLDDTSNTGRRAINGQNNWLLGPYSAHWQVYNGNFISSTPGLDTTGHVFAVTQAADGSTAFYTGGTNTLNGTNIATKWPGDTDLAHAPGEDLLGWVCEVRIYDHVLTLPDLNTVFMALTNKWNLP